MGSGTSTTQLNLNGSDVSGTSIDIQRKIHQALQIIEAIIQTQKDLTFGRKILTSFSLCCEIHDFNYILKFLGQLRRLSSVPRNLSVYKPV